MPDDCTPRILATPIPVLQLGLPDAFIDHGEQSALLAGIGLDAAGIEQSIDLLI